MCPSLRGESKTNTPTTPSLRDSGKTTTKQSTKKKGTKSAYIVIARIAKAIRGNPKKP